MTLGRRARTPTLGLFRRSSKRTAPLRMNLDVVLVFLARALERMLCRATKSAGLMLSTVFRVFGFSTVFESTFNWSSWTASSSAGSWMAQGTARATRHVPSLELICNTETMKKKISTEQEWATRHGDEKGGERRGGEGQKGSVAPTTATRGLSTPAKYL